MVGVVGETVGVPEGLLVVGVREGTLDTGEKDGARVGVPLGLDEVGVFIDGEFCAT